MSGDIDTSEHRIHRTGFEWMFRIVAVVFAVVFIAFGLITLLDDDQSAVEVTEGTVISKAPQAVCESFVGDRVCKVKFVLRVRSPQGVTDDLEVPITDWKACLKGGYYPSCVVKE